MLSVTASLLPVLKSKVQSLFTVVCIMKPAIENVLTEHTNPYIAYAFSQKHV